MPITSTIASGSARPFKPIDIDYLVNAQLFVGNLGSGGYASYSLDGVNWRQSPSTDQQSATQFVFFSGTWYTLWPKIFKWETSTRTWSEKTRPQSSQEIYNVTTDGTTIVAVGSYNESNLTRWQAMYSTDGNTWSNCRSGLNSTDGFGAQGIAHNGSGTWVAVGGGASGANVYSTTNLTGSWTARTTNMTNYPNGVAFGDSTWVVAGVGGELETSTNLTSWTTRTSGFSGTTINDVGYGNGLFVAVGNSGKISTSSDGATWTARTSGTSVNLYSVKYCVGLQKWFASGTSPSLCLSSSDGVTWTDVTPSTPGGSDVAVRA